MQACLYRAMLAGFAREAEDEAIGGELSPGGCRAGGFLEAKGLRVLPPPAREEEDGGAAAAVADADDNDDPDKESRLSPEVAALLIDARATADVLLPRGRRRRRASQASAAAVGRGGAAPGVVVLCSPAPPPPPPTLADALRLASRLASAALGSRASDYVRVEFVGQEGEAAQGRGQQPPLYQSWIDAAASPGGRALARRAARRLSFLRGGRAPTRRSGDVLRDSGCRWCHYRERCAGMAVRQDDDDDEEEEDDDELF